MKTIEATIEPSVYDAITQLFLRVLNRDQTERVGFVVGKGRGAEWIACAYVGETPPDFAKHYARTAVAIERAAVPEQGPDAMSRVGRGATAEQALLAIKIALLDALTLRIKGDLGAFELGSGRPFPGMASLLGPAADPHATPPDEAKTSKTKLLPRGA